MASPMSSHAASMLTDENVDEWCQVYCTVCTGFEKVASEEAKEILGVEDVRVGHGHIVIRLPVKNTAKVLTLNGVDNCAVLVHENLHFGFGSNEEGCMKQLQYLVENVDWRMGIKVWSQVYSFHLPISEKPVTYPVDFGRVIPASAIPLKPKQEKSNRNDYGKKKKRCKREENENTNKGDDAAKVSEELIESDVNMEEKVDKSSANITAEVTEAKPTKKSKRPFDPTKPTFRVTCHRSGENHAFSSMIAAANFGGAIQTYFDWNVDMKNFNIEVILRVVDDSVSVSIALTKESLHRRLITNFGPTTLRATTAYNMLRCVFLSRLIFGVYNSVFLWFLCGT
ncbi:THUMP domain-containing protein 3-like [Octopus sinensis]|uniref:THUMP domain-containing protein 3-like n=1 Tax=Octopus sinensis TaxID=2607531 RepID=A0A6P7SUN9_9MOLL|nr:THUMP domain-containing protein 3-like [Octopus sinensis]